MCTESALRRSHWWSATRSLAREVETTLGLGAPSLDRFGKPSSTVCSARVNGETAMSCGMPSACRHCILTCARPEKFGV